MALETRLAEAQWTAEETRDTLPGPITIRSRTNFLAVVMPMRL